MKHIAQRQRVGIAREPFKTSSPHGPVPVSVSIGATLLEGAPEAEADPAQKTV